MLNNYSIITFYLHPKVQVEGPPCLQIRDKLVFSQQTWGSRYLRGAPSLLTHVFRGAEDLPELADAAQFAGQAEVYDLDVPER